jgi:hypothetical protein
MVVVRGLLPSFRRGVDLLCAVWSKGGRGCTAWPPRLLRCASVRGGFGVIFGRSDVVIIYQTG